jgi:large subunit ribosomal protein L3
LPDINSHTSAIQQTEGRRTGALAMKVGMLPLWDQWGERHATTVLHLDTCQVVQVKTNETEGYTALKLGVGQAKLSRVNITTAGQYKKAGLEPNRKLMEFRVTPDSILPVGTKIQAMHFIPGQVSLIVIQCTPFDVSSRIRSFNFSTPS